jgi:hypothetical protein
MCVCVYKDIYIYVCMYVLRACVYVVLSLHKELFP